MVIDLHKKLQNVTISPAYDHTCDPRCNPSRAKHPLAKKLLYIPHHKLADNLNLDYLNLM